MIDYQKPYFPAYRFLTLAKYRVDFIRSCFSSFGIYKSWHLFKLLHRSEPNAGTIHLPAEIAGAPLLLRNGTSDIDAFYKIFAWKEYHLPPDFLPNTVRVVVDLGANIGLSASYFASRFPKAKIIALEPDSENYELLKANTRNMDCVNAVNGAIWNRRVSLKIENPDDRPDSYRLCECSPNMPGSVCAFSIPDLLETYHLDEIDILKADIEGAEVQLFSKGCEAWLPKVHTLIIELHGKEIREQLVSKIGGFFHRHFRRCENDVFVR